MLTRDIMDISPSDVLITGQSMSLDSGTIGCVNGNFTILGLTGKYNVQSYNNYQYVIIMV